jgi:hypothetical protein
MQMPARLQTYLSICAVVHSGCMQYAWGTSPINPPIEGKSQLLPRSAASVIRRGKLKDLNADLRRVT